MGGCPQATGQAPCLSPLQLPLPRAWTVTHAPHPRQPPPAAAEIPPSWMELFQWETMFLIGDKRLFPVDPVLGAMGKGCPAQNQAFLGREGDSGSVCQMQKGLIIPSILLLGPQSQQEASLEV